MQACLCNDLISVKGLAQLPLFFFSSAHTCLQIQATCSPQPAPHPEFPTSFLRFDLSPPRTPPDIALQKPGLTLPMRESSPMCLFLRDRGNTQFWVSSGLSIQFSVSQPEACMNMDNQMNKTTGEGIAAEAVRIHRLVDDRKYRWGGKTLEGFDCSGFVSYVLGNIFPHLKNSLQGDVERFIKSDLFTDVESPLPGDLIIFPATEKFVNHIGIVIDQNRWLGSQSSTGVEYVKFQNGFWSKRKSFFRRLKVESPTAVSSYFHNIGIHYA
jgi:hypothetical protein